MLDDIGKDIRKLAIEMQAEIMEKSADMRGYSFIKDEESGMIYCYPDKENNDVRLIKIRPLPLAGCFEIAAFMKNENAGRCLRLNRKHLNGGVLAETIRRLTDGG